MFQIERFCQVLSSGFHRQLVIPSKFVERLEWDLGSILCEIKKGYCIYCGPAFLKGRGSKIWNVELMETQDGLVFRNGWLDFVQDHSLEEGDILFFMYKGKLNFDVLIFDNSSLCEKTLSYFNSTVSMRSSLPYPSNRVMAPLQPSTTQSIPSEAPITTAENGRRPINWSTKPVSAKRKRVTDQEGPDSSPHDSDSDSASSDAPALTLATGTQTGRQPVDKAEIQRCKQMAEDALAASQHKSFLRVIRPVDFHYSPIPRDFSKEHLPLVSQNISLCCGGRRRWDVWAMYPNCNFEAWGAFIGEVWKDFVEWNNIEEDDVCLYELADDEQGTVFNVRIFQVERGRKGEASLPAEVGESVAGLTLGSTD